jgi:hypothetical protein
MSSADQVVRLMRLMTHVNIGVALGLAAWIAWSGWQVVSGQRQPAHQTAQVRALLAAADAARPLPMRLVPVGAAGRALPSCVEPWPRSSPAEPAGIDL